MHLETLQTLLKVRRPYYILTPNYRRQSAGIRAMHLLCHLLNRAGEDAYIVADVIDPQLQTPQLTPEIEQKHLQAKARPIAVYPEIVFDNPLDLTSVARIVLNHPGLIEGPKDFPETDLLFFYNPEFAASLPDKAQRLLQIPTINTALFNNLDNPLDSLRKEKLVYPSHYKEAAESYPELFKDATIVNSKWPETHAELANLLRSAASLHCFSNSAIAQEAVLCGCPVIFVETPYTKKFVDTYRHNPLIGRPPGMAIDLSEAELARARSSIADFAAIQRHTDLCFIEQLSAFIQETQALPDSNTSCYGNNQAALSIQTIPHLAQTEATKRWLQNRSLENHDFALLEQKMASEWHEQPEFHLLLRLDGKSSNALADTLDSLGQQFYERWHLDVISDRPSPEGVDQIPCLGWHQRQPLEDNKTTIDACVLSHQGDWVIEIPAGAILDPLCLWRIAKESQANPETKSFFTDDLLISTKTLRLKPGANQATLSSSDLAGPLFVRKDIWLASGGASQRSGSPWFSQLLRITEKFGWASIKHIPDVLISYPESFPCDIESCLLASVENLKQTGVEGEIIPATGQSWNIRYPLSTTPNITIAILSQGQLDLLKRCLSSIIDATNYINFEIVIALTDTQEDPELHSELLKLEAKQLPSIRTVRTSKTGNSAMRCNAAVAASTHDFVLLIDEGAVIIQEKWLEELLRTCLQANVSAVSPSLISPGTALIENAGNVIGLCGLVGSPYRGEATLGDSGYLDSLRVARDVSALSANCMLVRTKDYLDVGGMDDTNLGDHFADTDLCQKLRVRGKRLIYQPMATVAHSEFSPVGNEISDAKMAVIAALKEKSSKIFASRWLTMGTVDPFFNPNLSLSKSIPTPETDFRPQWQDLPSSTPRILARPLPNTQGAFRISSPLRALRNAGLITECLLPQEGQRNLTAPEVARLAPDTLIVQNYVLDLRLAELEAWQAITNRPFTVYALDDLLTDMEESNHMRAFIPANTRARLKFALDRCDRMVVTTEFLSDAYRHFSADIRVVPNRLEQERWLPLQSFKRTGKKPRIGWAGGTTHQEDLLLLKEVIEQTKEEADWIFFGMCPAEIRPMLAEYHHHGDFYEYPAKLAALNLDIAVSPLVQTPFNQGKSNLRLLEYGALGISVVCTDIDPYRNSPACRVENTVAAWTEALRARIYDANAREQEGAAMRSWVHENYLLENHLNEWLAAHLPG